MASKISICWFRQDLRIEDNLAWNRSCMYGRVLPIYIFDETAPWKAGAASRWWLHHSLAALYEQLQGKLIFFRGNAQQIIDELVLKTGASALFFNRRYEPWALQQDQGIQADLTAKGLEVLSFNGTLLWEPWTIFKADRTPYKVFTPFFKACQNASLPRRPASAQKPHAFYEYCEKTLSLSDLSFLPKIPWDRGFVWKVGAFAARNRLEKFIKSNLGKYRQGRDFPAEECVSRLSAHLHFGEISVHQILGHLEKLPRDENVKCFFSELVWREFSYYLLYHFSNLADCNFQRKFDAFPWQVDEQALHRWQKGQTGIPIVDAGMRQLWQTGYMHNRLRMITASFLVKNLMIDWRKGARWFWDCLVDADLANNSASWQWVAGCGTDAAPFFRIFNPVTQGQKFDPEGEFTRQFVPEIRNLPKCYLFEPWEAPQEVLKQAGIILGQDYPRPIVDIKESRQRALHAYKELGK